MRALLLAVTLWLALCSAAASQPADRPLADRLAVLGSVALPLATGAALMGYADGLVNEWGWCVDVHGRQGVCLPLIDDRHTADNGGRALVLAALTAAAVQASVADLSPGETAMVGLSASLVSGMAFSLGHNVQQGQVYYYAGTVAATDKVARGLGPRTVWWVSAGVTAGVVALTVWALR